ncbi:MAG: ABC transporter ATP-binding protein [Planctomycetales bacterium]|nr:ABC transporter ATP-binding protein [Planctomycetales bacterium]
MIDVVRVTQHYGMRPVLRDLSLQVAKGELLAVLGPNGMGKTTLLSVMAGVLSPQHGHVEINGRRRRATIEDELAIRAQVSYLADHPWLPKWRTGREFALEVGRLYSVDEDRLLAHAEDLFQLFGLKDEANWPLHSYSNGQKHKAAICATLIAETPVMILDEPFSGGLDPAGILALRRILKHLVTHCGRTVVLSAPVPELLEELADRIAIVRDGQLVALDTPAALRESFGGGCSLSDALQHLIHPQTVASLESYLGRMSQ